MGVRRRKEDEEQEEEEEELFLISEWFHPLKGFITHLHVVIYMLSWGMTVYLVFTAFTSRPTS
jgi:hypothetical protein